MILPDPIRRYFDADTRDDAAALAGAFAADAVVHDEHATHRGAQAIRDWWQAAKSAYGATAEPLELSDRGDWSVVRARVSGDFPGSPAVLSFNFTLADDRITGLEIS